ncbi:hypothetical protein EWM64_g1889 [Hericium alpestre]|uniref:Uncharacterized protein n=1 Tax=Hericium alpestre TaxID=135208 RepID=A0A4Z0A6L3_9AGAM|nr:hypothetical protein EWM64_g1889 [Hericium alpestre]
MPRSSQVDSDVPALKQCMQALHSYMQADDQNVRIGAFLEKELHETGIFSEVNVQKNNLSINEPTQYVMRYDAKQDGPGRPTLDQLFLDTMLLV